jgi:hypothetical protein
MPVSGLGMRRLLGAAAYSVNPIIEVPPGIDGNSGSLSDGCRGPHRPSRPGGTDSAGYSPGRCSVAVSGSRARS